MSYPIIGKERWDEMFPGIAGPMNNYSWVILSSDLNPVLFVYGVDQDGKVGHRYIGLGHSHRLGKEQVCRGGKIRQRIARFLLRFVA